jgi:hypothetical protein
LKEVDAAALAAGLAATIFPPVALVSVSAPPKLLMPPAVFQVPLLVKVLGGSTRVTVPLIVPLLVIVVAPLPVPVLMARSVVAPERFSIVPLLVMLIGCAFDFA